MAQIRRQFWAKSDAFSTDKKKIAYISAHFTGHASTWFDDILESEAKLPVTSTEPKLLESYEAFMESFKLRFSDPGHQSRAIQQLHELKQGIQSVMAYAVDFRNLARICDFGEAANIDMFRRGLSTRITRHLIATKMPSKLDEVITLVVELENTVNSNLSYMNKSEYRSPYPAA
ncbi:Retrotransposon-derived protein PEG10, partial [Zancudomyces culisetae]